MYILRHIDPLCMFRGYVVLTKKICRTDPQCIPVAVLYYDCMDPQCMIGGHDLLFMMSSVYDLSMGMPTSEWIYMILC
jgi:hypothetical protein